MIDKIIEVAQQLQEEHIEQMEHAIANPIADSDKPPQKYAIGERVKVQGWVSSDYGVVEEISWVFHHRSAEYCWGYHCKYEGKGPGLAFHFVPEGYVRKI